MGLSQASAMLLQTSKPEDFSAYGRLDFTQMRAEKLFAAGTATGTLNRKVARRHWLCKVGVYQ